MATGPITAAVESAAASVGAGMLLGGFVGGVAMLLLGLTPSKRDEVLLVATSISGMLAAVVVLLESI